MVLSELLKKKGIKMRLLHLNQNGWNWPSIDRLNTLRQEINRIWEGPLGPLAEAAELFDVWAPAIDLYEDKDNFIVRAELPGYQKNQLNVAVHEENLILSGERQREDKDAEQLSRSERHYGRFQRSVALPKPVDGAKVTASYKDGILTVTLPKTPEAKPRQVEVKSE